MTWLASKVSGPAGSRVSEARDFESWAEARSWLQERAEDGPATASLALDQLQENESFTLRTNRGDVSFTYSLNSAPEPEPEPEPPAPHPLQSQEQFDAAMADANPRPLDRGTCGHQGPGGSCCRAPGHNDEWGYPPRKWWGNNHHSYDTDHFVDWPVGWKSMEATALEAADVIERVLSGSNTPQAQRLRGIAVMLREKVNE